MIHAVFNYCEAVFWIVSGIGLLAAAGTFEKPGRKFIFLAGMGLIPFGLSDVVEVYSGAWWKPLWLLGLKIFCILWVVTCAVLYRISVKKDDRDAVKNDENYN